MKVTFARWFYTFIMLLLLPLLGIYLWRQKRASELDNDSECLQRLGFGIAKGAAKSSGGWLFHCASVGEVVAASGLINTLLAQYPNLSISITTASATGGQRVKQLFSERVSHYYLPVDLPWCMARLLTQLKPQKLIITEVELWPNLLHQCAKQQIPVYLINARMTDASRHRIQRFNGLFQPMLSSLCYVGAQGQRDYDNYLKLGLSPKKLCLTGNIKFDLQLTDEDKRQAKKIIEQFNLQQRPILIAGSTHDPEEQVMLDAFRHLKQSIPDLLLILVPRHPQRFEPVFQLCQQAGWTIVRASLQQPVSQQTDIFLGDGMGLLKSLYAAADVAFVGGSIAQRGGHNPLEAAIWSVPILMGPSQFNNPQICALLMAQKGMQVIEDSTEMVKAVLHWFEHNDNRLEAGEHAHQVILDNSGALAKSLAMLEH